MAEESDQEKTEPASPQRLEKAREEGQVVQSRELATFVVLMASGNASIMSWNIFDSTRTITATIAAELAETVFGGHHYRILFTIGHGLWIRGLRRHTAVGG